jgi:type IV secretory pathway TraG/TraD family ATPase VirD4
MHLPDKAKKLLSDQVMLYIYIYIYIYIYKASVSTVVMRHFFTNNPSQLFQINPLHDYRCQTILYLKHQFQRSSCVIFLQITPHSYFKLIRYTSIDAKRRPIRARCTRATTMTQACHAGLLTVLDQPVSPSIHLIKSA